MSNITTENKPDNSNNATTSTNQLNDSINSSPGSSNNDQKTISKQNSQSSLNASINSDASAQLDFVTLSVEEVYSLAREFVKAKDGTKAIHLSYNDRNMMNVLTKQVRYCKFDEAKSNVGFLDLVGKDRLQLWKSLGDLSKEDAMKKYINLVIKVCPLFYAHFEAHKRHLEEQEQKRLKQIEEEEQKRREMTEQKEKKLREEDLKLLEENKKRREEVQRKQIQEALNQQTYPHFKAYAEQQHPNNVQAQEELIKQLQEQHFEQYMNQVYQQQLLHQQQQAEQLRAMRRAQKKQEQLTEEQLKRLNINGSIQTNVITENNNNSLQSIQHPSSVIASSTTSLVTNETVISHDSVSLKLVSENEQKHPIINNHYVNESQVNHAETAGSETSALTNNDDENDEENDDDDIELPPISAASMLTRKDVKEFKESVRRDNDAIIKVGSGETVTVRVPTHEDGRLIFWEFATDYYDLGFGLYFEWTISPSNNVTVHVSDSSEDEEGDEEGTEETPKQDVEKGDKSNENKPPCDEIIPIFRRDCHEEVYAGSHLYPGRGVYLLKFDNSYSLWRSKTLYYRVYYSK